MLATTSAKATQTNISLSFPPAPQCHRSLPHSPSEPPRATSSVHSVRLIPLSRNHLDPASMNSQGTTTTAQCRRLTQIIADHNKTCIHGLFATHYKHHPHLTSTVRRKC